MPLLFFHPKRCREEQLTRLVRILKKMALIAVVASLPLVSGPVLPNSQATSVSAQGDQLYIINFVSRCDYRCPFYDPGSGCWCIQLDPIIVEA